MSQIEVCKYCSGCGHNHPSVKGSEDVWDRKVGQYEERHICWCCKGTGLKIDPSLEQAAYNSFTILCSNALTNARR